MDHIKGITSESSHLYASAVREVDRRLHGIEEEKGDKGAADILNRAFFIVTVGLVFYTKISEETKSRFCCLFGGFSSPKLLFSIWSLVNR